MAEPKTRPTTEDPAVFLDSRAPEAHRTDSHILKNFLSEITGAPAIMWGEAIIGYGSYLPPQKGASTWPLICFSPRKASIVIYLMCGCKTYADALTHLGKHEAKGACLHIKKLSQIDMDVLKTVCARAYADMKARYGV